MKYIKTYGINGLLEWHGHVHSNRLTMKVDFTNGCATAYGVSPATFITKDELTQHVIENSEEFKGGRIRIVSVHEIPGSEEPEAPKEAEAPVTPVEAAVTEPEAYPEGNHGVDTIEVADKAEAVEWLKEHYPEKEYTGIKLRSKEAFERACKECNVEFIIKS